MDEFVIVLILLFVGCIVCGPIALVIGIIALSRLKARDTERATRESGKVRSIAGEVDKPAHEREESLESVYDGRRKSPEAIKQEAPPAVAAKFSQARVDSGQQALAEDGNVGDGEKAALAAGVEKARLLLEQRIGTRWILVAGVITAFVGVGFFLKYAYENFSISPLARVLIVAACGLATLAVGEITRRRGYGIVAKGVTALGFATLYAAIFSAYQLYGVINSITAFSLAIVLTTAAMSYAVVLDEILIAFLSLLGGFLTPVILSTGTNLPMSLFSYTLILGVGAMLCAYYRNWRAVNFLAFLGTFVLYAGWFEKFYRGQIAAAGTMHKQMPMALGWLAVFSGVYLLMPIFHELIRRVKARKEDVLLVLANASVTSYYLWTMLFARYRAELAVCAVALSAVHLVVMCVVIRRCRDDVSLRDALLVIGLFFLTVAVPIYFRIYAVAMAWAGEAVILVVIGLRYNSVWTQVAAAIALALSIGQLVYRLPMHTGAFRLVLNPAFGTWCFVAGAAYLYHVLYKRASELALKLRETIAQVPYAVMGLLLFTAASMEWHWYCHYNLGDVSYYAPSGQLAIFSAIVLLFTVRPVCPTGILCEILCFISIAAGIIFTAPMLMDLHRESFLAFANPDFVAVLVFIAAVFVCHMKYRRISKGDEERAGVISQITYSVLGFFLLWAVAAEWYRHCTYNLSVVGLSPVLLRGQVVIFAAAMLLFLVRPICPRGVVARISAGVLATVTGTFAIISFPKFYNDGFIIFANTSFAIVVLFAGSLFLGAWLLNRAGDENKISPTWASAFGLWAIFILWVLLTEEIYLYWYCRDRFVQPLANWQLRAATYISVAWAVYGASLMVAGFWRKNRTLRFSAIGLFALLLVKVFTRDTRMIESVYRIAAFLATGITLVGVSYLYQYLRKKGFFEAMLTEKHPDKR